MRVSESQTMGVTNHLFTWPTHGSFHPAVHVPDQSSSTSPSRGPCPSVHAHTCLARARDTTMPVHDAPPAPAPSPRSRAAFPTVALDGHGQRRRHRRDSNRRPVARQSASSHPHLEKRSARGKTPRTAAKASRADPSSSSPVTAFPLCPAHARAPPPL